MNGQYQLTCSTVSLAGRRGGVNEDYVSQNIPQDPYTLSRKGALFVVADGLGGHSAGQVASQLAAHTLAHSYYREPHNDPLWALERAMQAANHAAWERAARVPQYQGMATTLTAVVVRGGDLFIANVGDSRAYLARRGQLWQVTRDHSYSAELIARGLKVPRSTSNPWRRFLTRAVGRGPQVQVDLFQGRLWPGDALLLCSDGLHDFLGPREILRLLTGPRSPAQAASTLATSAYRHGSDDNISALVIWLVPVRQPARSAFPERRTERLPNPRLLAASVRAVTGVPSDLSYFLALMLGLGLLTWATCLALILSQLRW